MAAAVILGVACVWLAWTGGQEPPATMQGLGHQSVGDAQSWSANEPERVAMGARAVEPDVGADARVLRIVGMVVDAATGEPIDGVIVDSWAPVASQYPVVLSRASPETWFVGQGAKTDMEGRFELQQPVVADAFRLRVRHPRYATWESSSVVPGASVGRSLDLGRIGLDELRKAKVSVISRDGYPIEGALLYVSPARRFETRRDDSRSYRILSLERDGDFPVFIAAEAPEVVTDAEGCADIRVGSESAFDLVVAAEGFVPAVLEGASPREEHAVVLDTGAPCTVHLLRDGVLARGLSTVVAVVKDMGVSFALRSSDGVADFPPVLDASTEVHLSAFHEDAHGSLQARRTVRGDSVRPIALSLERARRTIVVTWGIDHGLANTEEPVLLGMVRHAESGGGRTFTESTVAVRYEEGRASLSAPGSNRYHVVAYHPRLGYGRTAAFHSGGQTSPMALVWGGLPGSPISTLRVIVRTGAGVVGDARVRCTYQLSPEAWPLPLKEQLERQDGGFEVTREAYSDARGEAVFPGVPHGEARLDVQHLTGGVARMTDYVGPANDRVVIELRAGVAVSGALVARYPALALQDMSVRVVSRENAIDLRTNVDAEGRFAFANVPRGSYRLLAIAKTAALWRALAVVDVSGTGALGRSETTLAESDLRVDGTSPVSCELRLDDLPKQGDLKLISQDHVEGSWLTFTRLSPYGRRVGSPRKYRVRADAEVVTVGGLGPGGWVIELMRGGASLWWGFAKVSDDLTEVLVGPGELSRVVLPPVSRDGEDRDVRLVAVVRDRLLDWIAVRAGPVEGDLVAESVPRGEYAVQMRTDGSWEDWGRVSVGSDNVFNPKK